jgi:hypothetical protein
MVVNRERPLRTHGSSQAKPVLTGSKGGFQFLHTNEETVPLSAQGIDMPGKAAELVLLSLKLQAGNPSIMRVLQTAGFQATRVLGEIDQQGLQSAGESVEIPLRHLVDRKAAGVGYAQPPKINVETRRLGR